MPNNDFTITLPEAEARIVHKLIQDYLFRRGHSGEYGAALLSAEVNITRQLFGE